MENVGCVTLRDEYVFRSRATPASYQVRDDTILHELSHMWFGDLVTMRWWDDLWLKESFATWASNFALSQIVEEPESAWASFTNGFKTWAYRQDQLPSTHPIAADMVDLEAVEQNFDGITYSKGASVLVQLVAFVGQEEFLAGCRQYFQRHAYGNTALGRPAGRPAHRLRPGPVRLVGPVAGDDRGEHPAARDRAVDDDGTITLVRGPAERRRRTTRRCGSTASPSGCTRRAAWRARTLVTRVGRIETDIAGERTEVPELVGLTQPELLLVNDDDLTYAKVRLDPRSLCRRWSSRLAVAGERPGPRGLLDGDLGHVPRRRAVRRGLRRAGAVDGGRRVRSGRRAHRARSGRQRRAALHPAGAPRRGAAALAGRRDRADGRRPSRGPTCSWPWSRPSRPRPRTLVAPTGWPAGWTGTGVPDGVEIDPELRWSAVLNLARLGRLDSGRDRRRVRPRPARSPAPSRRPRPRRPGRPPRRRPRPGVSPSKPTTCPTGLSGRSPSRSGSVVRTTMLAAVRGEVPDRRRGDLPRRGRLGDQGVRACGRTCCATCSRFPSSWPRSSSGWTTGWLETDLVDSVRRPIIEGRDNAARALRCQQAG